MSLTSDPVPNVRLNVARTCEKIAPSMKPEVKAKMKASLEALARDNDADVKYFATKAIGSL